MLALSYVEHLYAYRPSTLINLFLLFSTLFEAARTRTLWLQGYNRSNAIVLLTTTILQLIILGLETVEKRSLLHLEYRSTPPEATSGILSKWLFLWQIPLLRTGYKKQVEIDELFELDEHLTSQYLHDRFIEERNKGMSLILCKNSYNSDHESAPKKGGDNALLLTVLKTLHRPILAVVSPVYASSDSHFASPSSYPLLLAGQMIRLRA